MAVHSLSCLVFARPPPLRSSAHLLRHLWRARKMHKRSESSQSRSPVAQLPSVGFCVVSPRLRLGWDIVEPLNLHPYKGRRRPLAVLCVFFFCGCYLFYLIFFKSGSDGRRCRSPFIPRLCPPRSPCFHQPRFTAVHRFSIPSSHFQKDVRPGVLSARRLFLMPLPKQSGK